MTAIGYTPVTRGSPAAGSPHGSPLRIIGPVPRISPLPCTVHTGARWGQAGNRQSPGRGEMFHGRGSGDPRGPAVRRGSAGRGAALWSPARPGDQTRPGPRYLSVSGGPGRGRPGPGRSAAVVRRPRRGAVLGVELLERLGLLGHGRLARGARVAEAGPGAGQDAVQPSRRRGRVVPRLAPGHALLERTRRTGAGHRA